MPIYVDLTANPATTLDLTGTLWLNPAAELADVVSFAYIDDLSPTIDVAGEIRTLAGGRQRLITRSGVAKSYAWKLSRVSREQITWLEDHVGQLMCVRDDRGRKFYGTYLSIPISESTFSHDRSSASVALMSITHSEAV